MRRAVVLVLCLAAVCSFALGQEFLQLLEENESESRETLDCGFGFASIADKCYRFHMEPVSWSQAQVMCINEGTQLASVLTEEQYNCLLTHIAAHFPGQYWTSGRYTSSRWEWCTGDPMEENWWGRTPLMSPNRCAYFCSYTSKYWDSSCAASRRFICEKVQTPLGLPDKFKYVSAGR